MKEKIDYPTTIEIELKLAKQVEQTHTDRDALIAQAIDHFLRQMGL